MQWFFSTLSGARAALGLLFLRLALGLYAFSEGSAMLHAQAAATHAWWAIGYVWWLLAAAIVLGFLTALFSGVMGILILTLPFLHVESAGMQAFPDSVPGAAVALLLVAAILCTGAGAASIDARMFGRREIIIPRNTKPN